MVHGESVRELNFGTDPTKSLSQVLFQNTTNDECYFLGNKKC